MMVPGLVKLRNWILQTFKFADGEPGAVYPPFDTREYAFDVSMLNLQAGNGKVVLPHPFEAGALVIYGGPYRKKPVALPGMRLEPSAPADDSLVVDLPIVDFGVPEYKDLKEAVDEAYLTLITDRVIYVGCTGGFGRTGLVMACLIARVMSDCGVPLPTGKNATLYLRSVYVPNAVETSDQQGLVNRYCEDLHLSAA